MRLPHPANFALHKLLISGRRQKEKAERDREQALAVMRALVAAGKGDRLYAVFAGIPKRWQAAIIRVLKNNGEDEFPALLKAHYA